MAETQKLATAAVTIALLAACAPQQPRIALLPPPPEPRSAPLEAPPEVVFPAQETLDAYKKVVANRIVQRNAETYSQPMPEIMKSVVVLDITIDRLGQVLDVTVYRSNGFKHLEQRAVASVLRAGHYAAPTAALLQGERSVTFLETFLFRDDDCFQVRSLVGEINGVRSTFPTTHPREARVAGLP